MALLRSRRADLAGKIDELHRAGRDAVAAAAGPPGGAEPATGPVPEVVGVPEVGRDALGAPLLRRAILDRGCLIVRGLVPRDDAAALAGDIDRAFAARETGAADGYYEEFSPPGHPGFFERGFTAETGGMWTVDSPPILFGVLEMFDRAAVPQVLTDYLGERPAISAQKGTLRKVTKARVGWHQDGRFLGRVRTMNIWLALSRCGDVAPGLDLIPKRLEEIVPEVAGDTGIVRPIFEPGDAVLFDDLFLHSTAADDAMTEPRYAIETWFFAPSAFPAEYEPLLF